MPIQYSSGLTLWMIVVRQKKIQLLSQKSRYFDGRCAALKSATNKLLIWADLLENPVGSHSVCPVGNRVAAWLRQNMQRYPAG